MSVTSIERAKLGYGLGKEEGEAFWLLGMLETIKIGGKDTGGEYGLVEIVVRAGDGSPWHVHHNEDEWFYVLEGEFTVYVGDTRLSLTPGSFAFGPKGVPHTFIAETEGAKVLVGFQPFEFEGFLREAGEPATERVLPPPLDAPPDMAKLSVIAARNGFDILGPPGPPPGR
jgi:quercetin dioxygenase-like cupin family protein